jgi:hypothetical protein
MAYQTLSGDLWQLKLHSLGYDVLFHMAGVSHGC